MSVSYVGVGDPITAAQLNALTAELDAILRCAFGDKSFFCYGSSISTDLIGPRFFFGDSASWKLTLEVFPSATEYDHAAFEAAATALVVDSYDSATHVANVEEDGTWPLSGSLEAHKVSHLGEDYFCNQVSSGGKQLDRERYRRLDVAEIVMEAVDGDELTWDTKWNRYHFLRFHNLGTSAIDVVMPGAVTVTVPAFGIKSVRRAYPNANAYDETYRYLWKPISGDLLFWRSGKSGNNVGSLCLFHEWLDALRSISVAWEKPGVMWDGSSLLPDTLAGSTKLYRLKHRLGELISVEAASGLTPTVRRFTPTWADLIAGTNSVKLTESTLTIAADTGATTPVDLIGTGTTMGPKWPDQLPWTADTGHSSPAAPGTEDPETQLESGSWFDSGAVEHEVFSEYDYYALSPSYVWIMDGGPVSHDNTVTEAITFADATAGEGTTKPTCATASDGVRVDAFGKVTFPDSLAFLPVTSNVASYGYPWFSFGSTSFTYDFGRDLLGRWNAMDGGSGRNVFFRTSGTYGRKTSDYVGYTTAGVVTYEGHPDLSGSSPIDGGIDFNESRTTPADAVVFREEFLTSLAYQDTTTGMPDICIADNALERIANNIDSAWYLSNRTSLLAQTMTDADNQTLLRAPILAIHYNQVAGRLNAVHWITPKTLADVPYYGFGANGIDDGTWTASNYPADYGCAVLSTGSQAATLGLTITGTGSESHLTLTTIAAHAASLGFRYFTRRISGLRNSSNEYTRDAAATRRYHIGDDARIYGFTENNSGVIIPPETLHFNAWIESQDACLAELEQAIEDGPTLPTGWQWAGDDKFVTRSIPRLSFAADPLTEPDITNEEIVEFPALDLDPKFWPVADMPEFITVQSLADLYEAGTVEPKSGFILQMVNRFIITRTP